MNDSMFLYGLLIILMVIGFGYFLKWIRGD
jgi:hypothetical protein